MSDSILDMLSGQLGGQALEMITGQLGAEKSQVEKAVPAALGSLMTGLARNTQSSDGAGALAAAGAGTAGGAGSVWRVRGPWLSARIRRSSRRPRRNSARFDTAFKIRFEPAGT